MKYSTKQAINDKNTILSSFIKAPFKPLFSLVLFISLLSTGINSLGAAAAAQLLPIDDKYLQEVGSHTDETLYWLQTDPNDYQIEIKQKQYWVKKQALIAINDAKKNRPMIDPNTLKANFHYISFDIHPGSQRYFGLPAGLYYWNKANAIRVRPFEQITYESNAKERCFAKVGTSQCFDATRNPFALGKGSDKKDVTFAYQNAQQLGIKNTPLHPFDEPGWAETITFAPAPVLKQKPAPVAKPFGGMPVRPAQPMPMGGTPMMPQQKQMGAQAAGIGAVALPGGVIISVASSNVMSQGQYEHDYKQGRLLDLDTRTGLFHTAFQDPNQLADKDFVMLQEFGWGMKDKDIILESVIDNNVKKNPKTVRSLKVNVDKTGYSSVARDTETKGIVDLLYNGAKFELVPGRLIGQENGRYLGHVFALKSNPKVKVGVVSAHIQYGKPKQVAHLIQDIEDANSAGDIAGWIVGGDFNINYNNLAPENKVGLQYMTNAFFNDTEVGCCNVKNQRLTAMGKQQLVTGNSTTTWAIPEGIDYIWYRGALTLEDTSVYPAIKNQEANLLTGGNKVRNGTPGDDSNRQFYSDHAIVSAEFELGKAQPAQAMGPVQAKPVQASGRAQAKPFSYPSSQATGGVGRGRGKGGLGQQEEKERAEQKMIACAACTFENPVRNRACEVCGTPLPSPKQGQRQQASRQAQRGFEEEEEEEEGVGGGFGGGFFAQQFQQ